MRRSAFSRRALYIALNQRFLRPTTIVYIYSSNQRFLRFLRYPVSTACGHLDVGSRVELSHHAEPGAGQRAYHVAGAARLRRGGHHGRGQRALGTLCAPRGQTDAKHGIRLTQGRSPWRGTCTARSTDYPDSARVCVFCAVRGGPRVALSRPAPALLL